MSHNVTILYISQCNFVFLVIVTLFFILNFICQLIFYLYSEEESGFHTDTVVSNVKHLDKKIGIKIQYISYL